MNWEKNKCNAEQNSNSRTKRIICVTEGWIPDLNIKIWCFVRSDFLVHFQRKTFSLTRSCLKNFWRVVFATRFVGGRMGFVMLEFMNCRDQNISNANSSFETSGNNKHFRIRKK